VESLFFNAGDRRDRRTVWRLGGGGIARRVDISNGVLFFDLTTGSQPFERRVRNYDRLAMLIATLKGRYTLTPDRGEPFAGESERSTLLAAGMCDLRLRIEPGSRIFALAVGDFFLKRYLGGDAPLERLYRRLEKVVGIDALDTVPTDALSHYLIERIVRDRREETMTPLRMEHEVMGLWLHRLGLMEPAGEGADAETLRIARCVREVLTARYADPPTIPELARHCATNTTRLKSAFKQVYGRTVGAYVRALRLQQANELLKNRDLSIGDVARRVGYAHQGHFGRLFYETFGIHPKDLRKFPS